MRGTNQGDRTRSYWSWHNASNAFSSVRFPTILTRRDHQFVSLAERAPWRTGERRPFHQPAFTCQPERVAGSVNVFASSKVPRRPPDVIGFFNKPSGGNDHGERSPVSSRRPFNAHGRGESRHQRPRIYVAAPRCPAVLV